MTEEEKAVIVEVLCSQALADHLGDIRDSEEDLWRMLGIPKLSYDHPAWYGGSSAYRVTKARLLEGGLHLPDYLDEEDED